jgi:hypothetical protein
LFQKELIDLFPNHFFHTITSIFFSTKIESQIPKKISFS